MLVAIQVYETVEAASVSELRAHFDWSNLKTYDIDPPGRNHSVLLATVAWNLQN